MTAHQPSPGTSLVGSHVPVMGREVAAALRPRDGAVFVDGTFGRGGYAEALLNAARCTVWGIDRDPQAVAHGKTLAARYDGRLSVIDGRFSEMDRLIRARGLDAVDGVALDLGVSSPQLDDPARGFSFRQDGPLDMRMESQGASAADVVNSKTEADLADIIFRLGEERHARRIARAIVARRTTRPVTRTSELADIVRAVVPRSRDGIDPATRTFQALRLYVNDELGQLDHGLSAAEAILAPGGRLAVVSFHSLEDRRVKTFLRRRAGAAPRGSRHRPEPSLETGAERPPSFRLIERQAVRPTAAEMAANPRARSARLRWAERTAAAPWPRAEPDETAA
ncbi:MAG: 16S rRNA (cytosine(1402)-N(4))-methyltransferase RsmH [Alphaproteobacteria bacterium]|nr:16S rRNA (cytosine(1402)-N(4))-methyltransferase RsmH [Alphaproteobacteria bacterium]